RDPRVAATVGGVPAMNRESDALVDRVRDGLDASIEHLDAATLSRLNQARQAALAQRVERPWRAWIGAAVCASLLAVLVLPQFQHEPAPVTTALLESDMELLEDLDMLT